MGAGGQKHPKSAANDPLEAQYWEALNAQSGTAQKTGTEAKLCDVYYLHADQAGLPQELTNAQGQLVWQANYKTWGSTVSEEWEVKSLTDQPIHALDQGDSPKAEETRQQNLRFQGQYLDRETGLHYNTFRYYDADIGRFICPDPIGLSGGINLGSYAPNPIAWIDPWGWTCGQLSRDARAAHNLAGGKVPDPRSIRNSTVAIFEVKLPNGKTTLYAAGSSGKLNPRQRAKLGEMGVPEGNILHGKGSTLPKYGNPMNVNHAEQILLEIFPQVLLLQEKVYPGVGNKQMHRVCIANQVLMV